MLLLFLNDRLIISLLRLEKRKILLDLLDFLLIHWVQKRQLNLTLFHGIVQNGDSLQDSIVILLIDIFEALIGCRSLLQFGFE